MSPRTRAGIAEAARLVDLLAAVSPEVAAEFAAGLSRRLDPASPIFHPLRLAAEAAEEAAAALFAGRLDRVGGVR